MAADQTYKASDFPEQHDPRAQSAEPFIADAEIDNLLTQLDPEQMKKDADRWEAQLNELASTEQRLADILARALSVAEPLTGDDEMADPGIGDLLRRSSAVHRQIIDFLDRNGEYTESEVIDLLAKGVSVNAELSSFLTCAGSGSLPIISDEDVDH